MWVERRIEGDRNARMRLDRQPWTPRQARLKKALKHAAWLLIAAATGGAWIMYFNDAPSVCRGPARPATRRRRSISSSACSRPPPTCWPAWAREQVCTYMCPWPRFQGALLDQDSYVVTYERWRGEPRAPAQGGHRLERARRLHRLQQLRRRLPDRDRHPRRAAARVHRLRPVRRCLQRRHGTGRPAARTDYASTPSATSSAARPGAPPERRLVRPRTVIYAGVLLVIGGGMLVGLRLRATRSTSTCCTTATRCSSRCPTAAIRNGYTLKILNKSRAERSTTRWRSTGCRAARLRWSGSDDGPVALAAQARRRRDLPGLCHGPARALAGEASEVTFVLTDRANGSRARHPAVFRGPAAMTQAMTPSRSDRVALDPVRRSSRFFGVVLAANARDDLARDSRPGRGSRPSTPISRASPTTPAGRGAAPRPRSAGRSRSPSAEPGPGRLEIGLTLADRFGNPLENAVVGAALVRPTSDGHDLKVGLARRLGGRYGDEVALPLAGQWDVRFSVARGGRGLARRPPGLRPAMSRADAACGRRAAADRAPLSSAASEGGLRRLHLMVEGVHCGGCVRTIERALLAEPAVESARVNLTTRRLVVAWRGPGAELAGRLLRALAELGFRAVPFDPAQLADGEDASERQLLRALAVAGFAAGNVMLLSVSVWAGHAQGMGAATRGAAALVLGVDRPAGDRLCRPAVLRLGLAGAGGRPHQHGRADRGRLALAAAMSLFETVRGGEHAYFEFGGHAAVLPAGRALSRPPRARPARACGGAAARAEHGRRDGARTGRAVAARCRRGRWRRAWPCWSPPASGSGSTAGSSAALPRSTRA